MLLSGENGSCQGSVSDVGDGGSTPQVKALCLSYGSSGAIWNDGTLSVIDRTLPGNWASGNRNGGGPYGGAILNGGILRVTNSTLWGNTALGIGDGN
jgi:hypothetical protein